MFWSIDTLRVSTKIEFEHQPPLTPNGLCSEFVVYGLGFNPLNVELIEHEFHQFLSRNWYNSLISSFELYENCKPALYTVIMEVISCRHTGHRLQYCLLRSAHPLQYAACPQGAITVFTSCNVQIQHMFFSSLPCSLQLFWSQSGEHGLSHDWHELHPLRFPYFLSKASMYPKMRLRISSSSIPINWRLRSLTSPRL